MDGVSTPFKEVRFPNGDRPTQAPVCLFTTQSMMTTIILPDWSLHQHGLPLLDSELTVNNLASVDMVRYIKGYMPGTVIPNNRAARIRLIKRAIGCQCR